jgi:perosamine synthetase
MRGRTRRDDMQTPVPGARPYFDAECRAAILRRMAAILESGQLTLGPTLHEFEQRFAAHVGTTHAVAVSSGATALLVALQHFDLDGGEVIVPVETFVASANAVVLAGGAPRFVNIEPDTLSLDVDDVIEKIDARTRGVMVVHIGGLITPRLDELRALCRSRGVFLIEDAAHAHGSAIGSWRAGNLGDVGCFSLYATKTITSGEGGVVTTNHDALAEHARRARNHGAAPQDGLYEFVSLNYRMSDLIAAVAIEQLARLEGFIEQRTALVAEYRRRLAGVDELGLLEPGEGTRSGHWKLFARLAPRVDRDKLIAVMADRHRISVRSPYAPLCHQQPVFQKWIRESDDFRRSEEIMARMICLPLFVGLEDADVGYVVGCLKTALVECAAVAISS